MDYLYCTYLVKSEVDAATITASALTIGDNVGETSNTHGNIFLFHDSEDPDSVPYTPLTKFSFSNSDFKNAGQASAGNISSPDKTKIFDFAHASLVLAYDNGYYYRVPIVVPQDAGGNDQLEYLSWLCADVGSDELGRAYVKSLLSAGTVKNAKGESVSYLNKVYLEVDADTVFEYDDPLGGDHVKFTEKPLYIYIKAELDGSEDGSFGFTAAGVTERDQNLFGSVELVGLRAIGGKTDITSVLATQKVDTLANKLASGEWCRFLVTGAVYDGNPSVSTYREGFYTRDRARAYSKYLVLPCIKFSRIPQKQEDVLLVYSDTWKHYIDPDDTNIETKYNTPKLDPIKYDEYIGEGHTPLTLYYIESGERNSALGETYPVNVLELTRMEESDLFIKGTNGKPLANQNVTIHGGVYVKTAASGTSTVYENGKLIKIDGYEYKPKMDLLMPAQASSSSENVQGSEDTSNGLEALTFKTDKNGMIRVVLNMDQLRPNFEIQTGEDIMFVFQIEVDGYKPVIVS